MFYTTEKKALGAERICTSLQIENYQKTEIQKILVRPPIFLFFRPRLGSLSPLLFRSYSFRWFHSSVDGVPWFLSLAFVGTGMRENIIFHSEVL